MVHIVYALLRSYLDFQGYFRFFPMLMPKPCSGDFKHFSSKQHGFINNIPVTNICLLKSNVKGTNLNIISDPIVKNVNRTVNSQTRVITRL